MKNEVLDVALKDDKFKFAYEYGVKNGLIEKFSDDFMNSMKSIHLGIRQCSLYDFFMNGQNIGLCRETCDYLVRMFQEWEVHKGVLPAISGTLRSPHGEHVWIISEGKLYDPSLMAVIDENFITQLGYETQEILNYRPIKKK